MSLADSACEQARQAFIRYRRMRAMHMDEEDIRIAYERYRMLQERCIQLRQKEGK